MPQRAGEVGPCIKHCALVLLALVFLGAGKVLQLFLDQFARPVLGTGLTSRRASLDTSSVVSE